MPTLFNPQTPASGRREPADASYGQRLDTPSAGSRRPLAPAEATFALPLHPEVLCLQHWLDLNA